MIINSLVSVEVESEFVISGEKDELLLNCLARLSCGSFGAQTHNHQIYSD